MADIDRIIREVRLFPGHATEQEKALAAAYEQQRVEVERLRAEVARYRGAYAGAIDALEYGLAAQGAFVHGDDENGMTMLYDCLDVCEKHPDVKATLDAGIRDLAAKGAEHD